MQRETPMPGRFPSELKQRLLFVLMALAIFRVGSFIPMPGVDPSALLPEFLIL